MKTPDAAQVAGLVAGSRDLAHLELQLAGAGLRFRSRRRLRGFLERSWKRAHATEATNVRSAPVPASTKCDPVEVVRDGTVFRIYGAVHGQARFARMRPRVRDGLRSLLETAETFPQSDYATERGFARLLGLPRTKELDYVNAVFRRVGVRGFIGQLLRGILVVPLLPIALPLLVLSRDPLSREMRACLRDPGYIPRAARLWALTRLPPHIRLELERPSFGTIHSEEMARSMLTLARASGLRSLTVLVGLGHADEIGYYLEVRDPSHAEAS